MGPFEGDLLNISADLYPQEVNPLKKLEISTTTSSFEPKEHFANWIETEYEPWEFDPCSDMQPHFAYKLSYFACDNTFLYSNSVDP